MVIGSRASRLGGTKVGGGPVFHTQAKVAHLVEHDLAKVGVAGSSPVFRSLANKQVAYCYLLFF